MPVFLSFSVQQLPPCALTTRTTGKSRTHLSVQSFSCALSNLFSNTIRNTWNCGVSVVLSFFFSLVKILFSITCRVPRQEAAHTSYCIVSPVSSGTWSFIAVSCTNPLSCCLVSHHLEMIFTEFECLAASAIRV